MPWLLCRFLKLFRGFARFGGMSSRAERRLIQDAQRAQKAISKMSPSRACDLILVRHGQTAWNVEQRLQGQLVPGPPLDAMGQQQAAALAERLKPEQIDRMYCSDLLRAVQTAEVIAAAVGEQVVTFPDLRERNLGPQLQGLTYREAEVQQPQAFRALMSRSTREPLPGGGESVDDLRGRAASALESIARQHPGQRVLVVTHGGFLHAAHWRATSHSFGGRNINGALNFIKIDPLEDGQPCMWALVRWGDVDHLGGVGFMSAAFGGGDKSG